MKVICKKRSAKGLDLSEVTSLRMDEYDYGLIIGKEYIVMGLMSRKDSSCLYYLVDENTKPFWIPYLLFEISDNSLPKNWYLDVFPKDSSGNILYLCGFDELCNNENYHDQLMEREETAMRIYFRNKINFENES